MTRKYSDGHPKVLPACNFLSQYYFYNIFLQKSCRFSLQTLTKFEAAKTGSSVGFLRLTAVCTIIAFLFAIGHVRYINILAWLRGFRVKIANFSSFFCPSIPKRDLDTKKTTPNIEVWPESLGTKLEYWYIERGLLTKLKTVRKLLWPLLVVNLRILGLIWRGKAYFVQNNTTFGLPDEHSTNYERGAMPNAGGPFLAPN